MIVIIIMRHQNDTDILSIVVYIEQYNISYLFFSYPSLTAKINIKFHILEDKGRNYI